MPQDFFASPPSHVPQIADCSFYHVMNLPGHSIVGEQWDLRGRVEDYLGHVSLGGKRVLEIGPASGFLTVEMERLGATVVAVDVQEGPGWDYVPYPAAAFDSFLPARKLLLRQLRNSFWLVHHLFHSQAKVWYGDTYQMPDALGHFDVAVIAAVLLHKRSPVALLEQCARRADILIITEPCYGELEGSPICRLNPTPENRSFGGW